MLSVIIPTLNEAAELPATLRAVAAIAESIEVICVDGGSTDATRTIASEHGVRVVDAPRGRGSQLRAGAAVAGGEVLWFLHADTQPPPTAGAQIQSALANARVVGGNFRLHFLGPGAGARFLNGLYPRLAWLGLRYGDSGIWVRRDIYDLTGGIRPVPLFEDLDLIRRVGSHGTLVTLPGVLRTSSRRFEGKAFAPVFAQWVWLQLLYWLGQDPDQLGRKYYGEQTQRLANAERKIP
jgi:rSAM/selenodomain-associated transferase 2